MPERQDVEPRHDQRTVPDAERRGGVRLIVSRDGRDASLRIHQDANVYTALLGAKESVEHELRPGRWAWIQIATGSADVNDAVLLAGDGVAIDNETVLGLASPAPGSQILLFDLP